MFSQALLEWVCGVCLAWLLWYLSQQDLHFQMASGTIPTSTTAVRTTTTTTTTTSNPSKLVKPTNAHTQALANLREFLAEKTCYDILPESYRLIVFDNSFVFFFFSFLLT
jgi:hypothetical protein